VTAAGVARAKNKNGWFIHGFLERVF
jgi:hypothetical protein